MFVTFDNKKVSKNYFLSASTNSFILRNNLIMAKVTCLKGFMSVQIPAKEKSVTLGKRPPWQNLMISLHSSVTKHN